MEEHEGGFLAQGGFRVTVVKLVISIDVEEEGLFSGNYPRVATGVSNVSQLDRLRFLSTEFGVPLTLLATYPVATSTPCATILRTWHERFGAEIGAHLHPWNTPPFGEMSLPEPVRSDNIPASLLEARLHSLISVIHRNIGVRPVSFRMGRFDLGSRMVGILPTMGVLVDSSMVPLRTVVGGPNHFLCPSDPYWLLRVEGCPALLEVPVTQVPVWRPIPGMVHRLGKHLPKPLSDQLQVSFRYVAALGIHPAWYPLRSMKWAVRVHHRRGGRVLNLFLHSSELQPGATPGFKSEADVRQLVRRIRLFMEWLNRSFTVEPVTLSGVRREISE